MADLDQHIRAALHHAAATGYGHMTNELRRELMNAHHIIEERPHAWKWALVQAAVYAAVFLAMGYFGRPIIEMVLG